MALTLGLTGMDPATEASLKIAFVAANARTAGAWALIENDHADHVIVDMDSMYGPISWLRLHAAGKTVVGLTSAPRTQADFRLAHPFDAESLQELLEELAPETVPANVDAPGADLASNDPSVAPESEAPIPEQPTATEEASSVPTGPDTSPVAAEEPPANREPASEPAPAAPTVPHVPLTPAGTREPRNLTEWLASGKIKGQVAFERDDVTLLLDLDRREYFGPATLKPLNAHVTSDAVADDFAKLPDWPARAAALGSAHPLSRLIWFGGLMSGQGQLQPGFDPDARYLMLKWPQTEREYPRHFRIATVMMKGPATLASIAEASGVALADVTDFVNANLATGFADIEQLPEPEVEPRKPTGLFGRFRGR